MSISSLLWGEVNKYDKRAILVATILSLSLFSIFRLTIDYKLILQGNPPKFATKTATYKDGGTTVYSGLGYIIIDYNQMAGRKDIQFLSPFFIKSVKDRSIVE